MVSRRRTMRWNNCARSVSFRSCQRNDFDRLMLGERPVARPVALLWLTARATCVPCAWESAWLWLHAFDSVSAPPTLEPHASDSPSLTPTACDLLVACIVPQDSAWLSDSDSVWLRLSVSAVDRVSACETVSDAMPPCDEKPPADQFSVWDSLTPCDALTPCDWPTPICWLRDTPSEP